jgi:hypothetical protein
VQADLKALTAACKERGMLFMLDVVANHVGAIPHGSQITTIAGICRSRRQPGLNVLCFAGPIHSVAQLEQLGPGLNSPEGNQVK